MPPLSPFDEYAIHQTSEPLLLPATSDRNAYDRNWFGGFVPDGSIYFGFTIGVYPNRGVIDSGFSIRTADGIQHCIFASDRDAGVRSSLSVGPITMEIVEPMRRVRVTIADNDTGVHGELTFTSHTAAVEEPRQIMRSGVRRTTDATRFNQYGRWDGVIHVPGETIVIDGDACLGVKDRSWGIRRLGEREAPGPIAPNFPLFLWSELFWEGEVSHAILFDDAEGASLVRHGAALPRYEDPADIPGVEDPAARDLEVLAHRIRYEPGTRWISEAEIDLREPDGTVRTLVHRPLLRFQQRGLGYGHPGWPHGAWSGAPRLEYERIDTLALDPTLTENFHVQQLVTVDDGQRTGLGLLEHFILGPYAPAGFTSNP